MLTYHAVRIRLTKVVVQPPPHQSRCYATGNFWRGFLHRNPGVLATSHEWLSGVPRSGQWQRRPLSTAFCYCHGGSVSTPRTSSIFIHCALKTYPSSNTSILLDSSIIFFYTSTCITVFYPCQCTNSPQMGVIDTPEPPIRNQGTRHVGVHLSTSWVHPTGP